MFYKFFLIYFQVSKNFKNISLSYLISNDKIIGSVCISRTTLDFILKLFPDFTEFSNFDLKISVIVSSNCNFYVYVNF